MKIFDLDRFLCLHEMDQGTNLMLGVLACFLLTYFLFKIQSSLLAQIFVSASLLIRTAPILHLTVMLVLLIRDIQHDDHFKVI